MVVFTYSCNKLPLELLSFFGCLCVIPKKSEVTAVRSLTARRSYTLSTDAAENTLPHATWGEADCLLKAGSSRVTDSADA